MSVDKPPNSKDIGISKFKEKLFTLDQFNLITQRHWKLIKGLEKRIEFLEKRDAYYDEIIKQEEEDGTGDT